MPIATLINALAIIAGSILGIMFKDKFPDKIKKIIFQAMGLSTVLIGIQMFFDGKNVLIVIISLVIGGIAGELLNLETNFEKFIEFIKSKSNSKITSGKFSEGLITATLIFCIGSMAIVGSIDEGLRGNRTIILTKSILDGFMSIALASTYGIGVLFSFVFIILYQGSITLLAHFAQSLFSPVLIAQMTACGGIMITGIGLNILEIRKINVLNLLPGLVVVVILTLIFIK
jgi:uncharacterized membrane protein YqgA involved in biofilm formation